ncbi:hypothetical protein HK097_010960 [Rhizophlyctis rosea]|uniref:3'-5' exonuclease domain-containing protein n=1 Tax=Rhizophlyctis rosea TaxID=64517 RepID=A0AAD5S8L5_9FUNG|nr:hypothetical protein HK097_010960 [Rhizophlyctis rosea]
MASPHPGYVKHRVLRIVPARAQHKTAAHCQFEVDGILTDTGNQASYLEDWIDRHCYAVGADGKVDRERWKIREMGLDCEFNQPGQVVLVQMAVDGGHELSYHCPDRQFPNAIRRVLACPDVKKVGKEVWSADGRKLHLAGVNHVRGFCDIAPLWVLYQQHVNNRNVREADCPGLEALAEEFLGWSIKVGHEGHWARHVVLEDREIEYAAMDAIASLEVWKELKRRLPPLAAEIHEHVTLMEMHHNQR